MLPANSRAEFLQGRPIRQFMVLAGINRTAFLFRNPPHHPSFEEIVLGKLQRTGGVMFQPGFPAGSVLQLPGKQFHLCPLIGKIAGDAQGYGNEGRGYCRKRVAPVRYEVDKGLRIVSHVDGSAQDDAVKFTRITISDLPCRGQHHCCPGFLKPARDCFGNLAGMTFNRIVKRPECA